MSQMPPPPGMSAPQMPFMPPQPPRTNGWAIGSLVCGILGCLPIGITGLLGIILGIVGINKARQPNTGGRGLAIAGIVLGVLGLVWSAVVIGGGYYGYRLAQTKLLAPTQEVGTAFINSLSNGEIGQANSYTTNEMSQEELTSLGQRLKGYGEFKNFSINQFNANQSVGTQLRINLGGTANFATTSKPFSAVFTGDVNDPSSFKIADFKVE